MSKRTIELLAPARNLECGIEAINHGADAVYIGAEKFGARSEAGNSLDDIRKLVGYAHLFGCHIYVTVNTILFDDEIEATERLIRELYDAGVDALIVQDMSILKMNIPPIALHASTQMDNRTPEKVRWLDKLGFSQVVLARELSKEEIKLIHTAVPNMPLEVFVHGALCVSYSGQCYASQYCFGRSANRGECAQFCRLKFDLEDSDGNVLIRDRHLLSLKDMNQLDRLEDIILAGASSLKIEGRLKDVTYVKNVTAAYSEKLNEIIRRHPDLQRASHGRVKYAFTPSVEKSFNRSFTHYFLDGYADSVYSFDTPKSKGEYVGEVKEVRGNSFTVSGVARFVNGDGLCFIDDYHVLQGFRVNRVENNRLFLLKMPSGLHRGLGLYRNSDHDFEQLLSKASAVRKLYLRMLFSEVADGYQLRAVCEDGTSAISTLSVEKQVARTPQIDNIRRQLLKLGNTPFECEHLDLTLSDERFIPSGMLADLRRDVVEQLTSTLSAKSCPHVPLSPDVKLEKGFYDSSYTYLYNVSNQLSRNFYTQNGVSTSPAFEIQPPTHPMIMQCKYCLRHALGHCVKNGETKAEWREPLYLRLPNQKRFRLDFDCKHCKMNIYGE